MPGRITALYAVLVSALMLYFVGAAVYWRRAFPSLREKPYNQMRMAHQHFRLSVREMPPLGCRACSMNDLDAHVHPFFNI